MGIDKQELLYASLHNQYLLNKSLCRTVVSDLCGLQAQFANNPKYSLRIRGSDFSEDAWNDRLVKTWTFRGTLHAVLNSEAGLFLSARGVPDDWHSCWGLESRRMKYWSEFLMNMIEEGVCGREALKSKCREAGMPPDELQNVFHGWGGLIYEMSRRGLIAYAPGTAKDFAVCRDVCWMERDEARAILLRRYFKTFGPATIEDCAYFTGWKKRELLSVIEKFNMALSVISCENREYFYTGNLPAGGGIPPCLFLAGFDQLLMGYRDRSRILDERFKADVTTNSGIVHPTILLDGRIQAKWRKKGSKLIITPFCKITRKHQKIIDRRGNELFQSEVKEVCFE
ncbi:hypothetical protein FACS1894216_04570 [Synergistales bacterium]|nr:hypothetical protein FACS1894216_04570 [Synergistales bacterium]